VRYLEYIWTAISFDTPWVMGNSSLQLIAWTIGMIGPIILLSGLFFRVNKTNAFLSVMTFAIAASLIVWWLLQLDFWLQALPPANCDSEACDNDAEIRSLFAAGALLLPAIIPSLMTSLFTLILASRRIFRKATLA
jgi:hypothetical protein